VCVGIVLIAGALLLAGDTQRSADEIAKSSAPVIDLDKHIDNIIWDNVPSAAGIKIGGGGQAGFMLEGGASGGLGVVFNWRSMEISIIGEANAQGYIGTPQLIGKEAYLSSFYVYGVSRNEHLEGISDYTGITLSSDKFAKFGVSATESIGKTQNGDSVYIDPVSKKPIKTYDISINLGGNLAANGVDGGFLFGRSYTTFSSSLSWKLSKWHWAK
jgi:hypothetical protein